MDATETINGRARTAPRTASVESRASWAIALTALGLYTVSFGAPTITVVALKPIAAELGSARSVPALAFALAWFGSAAGGIMMGWLAEQIGIRPVVISGALMIAVGLVLSSLGGTAATLYVGHGLFMGVLGNGGINAPLYVYVSRWFDRRRGSAMALISSGMYLAGAIWPTPFERLVAMFGWRDTMLIYAVFEIAVILPVAAIMFRPAPETANEGPLPGSVETGWVLGLRPRVVQGFLCLAGFLCCIPMAMPQGHLVAFCSDLGIQASHGAAMLSVLLGCAFLSRQFWGLVTDRIGGLRTVLAGSVCQITAMIGFLLTQDEAGLFAVAAMFGLGFSGIIPAYVVAIRELFPAAEASWRIPTLLSFSGSGMAAGGWFAGLIYDYAGFYAAAFATGIAFNLANILVVGALVWRQGRLRGPALARA